MSEEDIRKSVTDAMRRRIDDAFYSTFGATTSNVDGEAKPATSESILADIREAMADLPPLPPTIRASKYATAFPSAMPRTQDMREMVDRIGRTRVPAAFHIKTDDVDMIVAHPDILDQIPR